MFDGKCDCCGATERLEFAHKDHTKGSLHGMGRGQAKRYLDVKKNPELYLLKCHDCHRDYDVNTKQLDTSQLNKYEAMALEYQAETLKANTDEDLFFKK